MLVIRLTMSLVMTNNTEYCAHHNVPAGAPNSAKFREGCRDHHDLTKGGGVAIII